MPEIAYQMRETIENVEAWGLSPVPGSNVAAPMPTPSMVRITCTTRATTTPARIAPQETRLIMIVWASSVAVACGPSGKEFGVIVVSVIWRPPGLSGPEWRRNEKGGSP
jgi:hypothetical protein